MSKAIPRPHHHHHHHYHKSDILTCKPLDSLTEIREFLCAPPPWRTLCKPLTPHSKLKIRNIENNTGQPRDVIPEVSENYCHFDPDCEPPTQYDVTITELPKTLVCHDMANGYHDDSKINGTTNYDAYTFYNWAGIDIFCYFSHHLITIPPLGWINVGHAHGVKVIGTIITEWNGVAFWEEVLASTEIYREFAHSVVNIAKTLKFDGWLLNIENKVTDPNKLLEFLKYLHKTLHEELEDPVLIWYDSVTITGTLNWQNGITAKNRAFFDICDGFFTNYSWTVEDISNSVKEAGRRVTDVFIGIDVWGRNFYGGGQFNVQEALKVVHEFGCSMAMFAPAWTHEAMHEPQEAILHMPRRFTNFDVFVLRDRALWDSIWPFLNTTLPCQMPFQTSFCRGQGKKRWMFGEVLSPGPWYNLRHQQYQPNSAHGSHGYVLSTIDHNLRVAWVVNENKGIIKARKDIRKADGIQVKHHLSSDSSDDEFETQIHKPEKIYKTRTVDETNKAAETPKVDETTKAAETPTVVETTKAAKTPTADETSKAAETPTVDETSKAAETDTTEQGRLAADIKKMVETMAKLCDTENKHIEDETQKINEKDKATEEYESDEILEEDDESTVKPQMEDSSTNKIKKLQSNSDVPPKSVPKNAIKRTLQTYQIPHKPAIKLKRSYTERVKNSLKRLKSKLLHKFDGNKGAAGSPTDATAEVDAAAGTSSNPDKPKPDQVRKQILPDALGKTAASAEGRQVSVSINLKPVPKTRWTLSYVEPESECLKLWLDDAFCGGACLRVSPADAIDTSHRVIRLFHCDFRCQDTLVVCVVTKRLMPFYEQSLNVKLKIVNAYGEDLVVVLMAHPTEMPTQLNSASKGTAFSCPLYSEELEDFRELRSYLLIHEPGFYVPLENLYGWEVRYHVVCVPGSRVTSVYCRTVEPQGGILLGHFGICHRNLSPVVAPEIHGIQYPC